MLNIHIISIFFNSVMCGKVMIKYVLVAVAVTCLSFTPAFSQKAENGGKLRGPRQTQAQPNENKQVYPKLVRNLGDTGAANPKESRNSSVRLQNSESSRGNIDKAQGKQITAVSNDSDLFHSGTSLMSLKMPGETEGVGLSSWVNGSGVFRTSSLVDKKRIDSLLMPGPFLQRLGSLPSAQENRESNFNRVWEEKKTRWKMVAIEVSHSSHVFTLYSETSDEGRKTLYECKIGLGSPEFPTPVGVYYVTHIYDRDPWWIPPPNRAWAAGDSPSQRVYGGTMAPLLKKKVITSRKKSREKEKFEEDFVENQVKLEDYGYRFHGTNQPRSIGRNQSHGCVRMLSDDAKKVSDIIKEQVGALDRRESENGQYVVLNSPVKLHLVK